ncbi:MAG TPA: hypothetical protein PKE29_13615 [Phycisphaerales bacterium]|nr:hypothetical protein [Phycisphaerales bacterium]
MPTKRKTNKRSHGPKTPDQRTPKLRAVFDGNGQEIPIIHGRAGGTVVSVPRGQQCRPPLEDNGEADESLTTIQPGDPSMAKNPILRLLDGLTLVCVGLRSVVVCHEPVVEARQRAYTACERTIHWQSAEGFKEAVEALERLGSTVPDANIPAQVYEAAGAAIYRCHQARQRIEVALWVGGAGILDAAGGTGGFGRSLHISKLSQRLDRALGQLELGLIADLAKIDQDVQECRTLREQFEEVRIELEAAVKLKGLSGRAEAPTNAPPNDPPSIRVELETSTVWVGTKRYPVRARAAQLASKIIEAKGHPVSGTKLCLPGKPNERIDRELNTLPDEVRCHFEGRRGLGYWHKVE